MKQIKTLGIVLGRTNYSEADRILTFLTPGHGKVRALARGVRKPTSKLAGSIELFSISDVSFVSGRGDLYTLTGSRLVKYYSHIVKDIGRTNTGYDFIKLLNKVTEDAADPSYFILAENTFAALDDPTADPTVIALWFRCRTIRISGHSPNLSADINGDEFAPKRHYDFDYAQMSFMPTSGRAGFTPDHIKFLRLNLGSNQPKVITRIQGSAELAKVCLPLADSILQTFVRI